MSRSAMFDEKLSSTTGQAVHVMKALFDVRFVQRDFSITFATGGDEFENYAFLVCRARCAAEVR